MSFRNPSDPTVWTSCVPGTLQALAEQLRATRRREVLRRVAAPLVVFTVLGVSSWTMLQVMRHSDSQHGGIACRDVLANLELFDSGRLPDTMSRKIVAHLRDCPSCQSLLSELNQPPNDEVRTTPLYKSAIFASILSNR
jgi:hypothetical protein